MIKILEKDIRTVGDILHGLKDLDPDTPLTPFGDPNTVIAYDDETKTAYLDNYDYIDTGFDINNIEPVKEVPMEDDDEENYSIEEASY